LVTNPAFLAQFSWGGAPPALAQLLAQPESVGAVVAGAGGTLRNRPLVRIVAPLPVWMRGASVPSSESTLLPVMTKPAPPEPPPRARRAPALVAAIASLARFIELATADPIERDALPVPCPVPERMIALSAAACAWAGPARASASRVLASAEVDLGVMARFSRLDPERLRPCLRGCKGDAQSVPEWGGCRAGAQNSRVIFA
jgi:hypothetical protein